MLKVTNFGTFLAKQCALIKIQYYNELLFFIEFALLVALPCNHTEVLFKDFRFPNVIQ